MAEPIKSLELRYPMTQFLMIISTTQVKSAFGECRLASSGDNYLPPHIEWCVKL